MQGCISLRDSQLNLKSLRTRSSSLRDHLSPRPLKSLGEDRILFPNTSRKISYKPRSFGNDGGWGGRWKGRKTWKGCTWPQCEPVRKDANTDNVPSEMTRLSGMILIPSLPIPETNLSDTEELNRSQIWSVSGLLLFWQHLGKIVTSVEMLFDN